MTDLKNIYDYLEKIDFEKRIKEEVKFIRDRRNSPDFEAFVSPFVITQFVFSIVRDFYEEIYKDIEKQNATILSETGFRTNDRTNKMTDLTEQWKKGELPEGHYYIKTRNETNIDEYIQWYKDHGIPSEKSFAYFNVQQVLAPVPSYDELENMNKAVNECMAANIKLVEQNAQLKELLKECQEIFDECFSPSAKHGELYKKIDEALK